MSETTQKSRRVSLKIDTFRVGNLKEIRRTEDTKLFAAFTRLISWKNRQNPQMLPFPKISPGNSSGHRRRRQENTGISSKTKKKKFCLAGVLRPHNWLSS